MTPSPPNRDDDRDALLLDAIRRAVRAEAELRELQEALRITLKYMERVRGGDPSLTSEEYYVVRDFARSRLAASSEEPGRGGV